MTEHFLNYKQALAVKKLGFNESCFALYAPPCKSIFLQNYGLLRAKEQILAPLKQQFFKWVREKYKISGTAQYFTGGYYCYTINDMKDTEKSNRLFTEFETYEQAEEACIDKIIELLKNK